MTYNNYNVDEISFIPYRFTTVSESQFAIITANTRNIIPSVLIKSIIKFGEQNNIYFIGIKINPMILKFHFSIIPPEHINSMLYKYY
jgi:hypothetical protein